MRTCRDSGIQLKLSIHPEERTNLERILGTEATFDMSKPSELINVTGVNFKAFNFMKAMTDSTKYPKSFATIMEPKTVGISRL